MGKRKTPNPGRPSAAHPHVRGGGGYFCPADGIPYRETREDAGVDRCLGCGLPVTAGGESGDGR